MALNRSILKIISAARLGESWWRSGYLYHNVPNLLKFIVHIIIVEYVYFDTYYFFVFALPKITATVPFIDVTVLVVLKGSDILAKVCARPTAAPIFYTFQRPCDVSLEGTVTVHSWK